MSDRPTHDFELYWGGLCTPRIRAKVSEQVYVAAHKAAFPEDHATDMTPPIDEDWWTMPIIWSSTHHPYRTLRTMVGGVAYAGPK